MVHVFLASGFEELEAVTVIDILRRAEIKVITVSISNQKEVEGAHEIKIIADQCIDDLDESAIKMIVLPGGLPGSFNLKESKKLSEIIKNAHNNQKYIAAICAAPLVLGSIGLLDKKKATCYPGFEKYLTGATTTGEKFVVDGNIITAKGPGAASGFALKLVEILKDKATAEKLRQGMLW
ncbi:MAG: DJ-1/PfpI family protein [Desulfotomaculum sp.]|nr:DJ-1/PfpI family protein [Desulfotomaculum sp.]MCL0080944.1 DJ-1/PfpI family protein [Peptococcaceae bacterium]